MKTTLLIALLLLLGVSAQSQPPTEATVYKIELHLDKFHKEYRTGTVFTIIGGAIAMAGIAAVAQDNSQPGLLYAGGALLTIGGLIHIDSHKWLSSKRNP